MEQGPALNELAIKHERHTFQQTILIQLGKCSDGGMHSVWWSSEGVLKFGGRQGHFKMEMDEY